MHLKDFLKVPYRGMFFERSTDRNDCLLQVSGVTLLRRGARSAEVGASQPKLTAEGNLPVCVTRHSLVRRRYHGYEFCAARSLDGVEHHVQNGRL